jgi:transcriptional regulator with XRE-family HTH domain
MKSVETKPSARLIFARNIRLARLELGMSQEDMAEACGLHRTYVGSVERGERNISIDNMEAMAEAVKKSLAVLVSKVE